MTEKITWWNSPARTLVYARWGVLVIMNTLFPLILAAFVLKTAPQFVGVFLAIASFVVFYAEFELRLINAGYLVLSKQLRISAAIKIGTPLLPMIDMLAGVCALNIVDIITGFDLEKTGRHQGLEPTLAELSTMMEVSLSYFVTIINGLLLSLVVGIVLLVLRFIQTKITKRRSAKLRNL